MLLYSKLLSLAAYRLIIYVNGSVLSGEERAETVVLYGQISS